MGRLKICVSATLKKKGIHTSTDLFKALSQSCHQT